MQGRTATTMHEVTIKRGTKRPLSYRNQSIDLHSKSMDWFLYDRDLRHERVDELRLPLWDKVKRLFTRDEAGSDQ